MSDEIDRDAIKPGDSLRWRHRSNGTACYGYVAYVDGDNGVHVMTGSRAKAMGRYTVPWERITGHWPGKEMYHRKKFL